MGKHCPACNLDIGLWPVFAAGLDAIRCPHCGIGMHYADDGVMIHRAMLAGILELLCMGVFGLISVRVPLGWPLLNSSTNTRQ
jgi:hypothetical protein